MSAMSRVSTWFGVAMVATACADPDVGAQSAAIVNGTPATNYPEAVYVTASGFLPCSGVLLTPTVVLSAGHCRSLSSSYSVTAPNANGQTSTASSDWTTYDNDEMTSSDTLLVFLDTPIVIDVYPTLASLPVANGTTVIDIGRTLDGTIGTNDYVSAPVTILGPATSLGFPFHYEAQPDLSEDGDSGGPIEIDGPAPRLVVAIVDTDTVEQGINEEEPIDLFERVDLVHDAIEAQIASHAGDGGKGVAADGGTPSPTAGGCAITSVRTSLDARWMLALALLVRVRLCGRRRVASVPRHPRGLRRRT
jgi:hypothetical protein